VLDAIDDGGDGPLSLIAKWGAGGTRALFTGAMRFARRQPAFYSTQLKL
jgi:hypothetical protein